MKNELNKIEHYLTYRDKINKKVSKVDVAWHLDHSLKVINKICDALRDATPGSYKSKFSLPRIVFLSLGYLPRGKGVSPSAVRPPDVIKTEDIVSQLAEARANVTTLDSLDKRASFKHPFFGQLHKKKAIRFIAIHTNHHLKIIRDILKEL